MRFFVFLLFLVSLLSVSGCKQENPEITKLWEEYGVLGLEIKELHAVREDQDQQTRGLSEDQLLAMMTRHHTILLLIVQIDPDALYVGGGVDLADKKLADWLEERKSDSFSSAAESQRKIKRLQDASDNFDRDMGN